MPLHCKKKHFWGLSNVLYIFFSKVGISRIAAAARSNIFTCLCGPINKALLGLFINYWANIQIICPQILSSGSTASFSTSRCKVIEVTDQADNGLPIEIIRRGYASLAKVLEHSSGFQRERYSNYEK